MKKTKLAKRTLILVLSMMFVFGLSTSTFAYDSKATSTNVPASKLIAEYIKQNTVEPHIVATYYKFNEKFVVYSAPIKPSLEDIISYCKTLPGIESEKLDAKISDYIKQNTIEPKVVATYYVFNEKRIVYSSPSSPTSEDIILFLLHSIDEIQ